MPATMYTFAIQTSDDGETWMTDADELGTEEDEYSRGAEKFAMVVLRNYLNDNYGFDVATTAGKPGGPKPPVATRVVVWNGEQQDTIDMAAAVINA